MRLWVAALVALTVLRLVLSGSLELTPDEAYYSMWAQHLQLGYFDHPPMVAYWMRASIWLFGDNSFGVRFFGPVAAAFGSVLLWHAGEQFVPHRQAGLIAAALLNATLLVGVGSIVMTPDTPLVFFWIAGIAALGCLIRSGNPRWWLAVGLAAGCALLSKYTGLLFMVAVFIWLVTSPEGRAQLRTPWPWLGAGIAVAVFLPDVWWNATHGWVSYFKQGSRETGFNVGRSAEYLAEFCFGQFGLATPILFVLVGVGLWRLRDDASPGAHLLVWLTVVPGVVLLEHIVSGRVEQNWAAILYPSACLAAAALPMAMLRRWLTPALGLGFGVTALVYAQALAAPLPLPPKESPVALQMDGWSGLAALVSASHPAFLMSSDYATASALAFYAPAGVPVVQVADSLYDQRWRFFDWPAVDTGGAAGIKLTRDLSEKCNGGPGDAVLGEVTRKSAGQPVMTYLVCRVVLTRPGVLLPRP